MSDYKNDIEKYLKGELTPAQMHALEKKALDDPFLADALEGAQHLSPDELATDISLLQASLNKRVEKQKGGWFWPMRIAAGLLLVAASTYFVISVYNPQQDKNLALHQEKEPSSAPPEKDSNGAAADSLQAHEEETSTPEIAKREKDEELKSNRQSVPGRPQEAPQPLADVEKTNERVTSDAKGEQAEEKIEDDILQEESKPSQPGEGLASSPITGPKQDTNTVALEKKKMERPLSGRAAKVEPAADKTSVKVVRGKVTFSDGTGLPGVNVIVKGSNQGTVTDGQGYYNLSVNEEDPTLTFSFIGFTSKEIAAKSNELNVQLETDVSELSEVVVVGDPSNVEEGFLLPNPPPVMELATPAGGRKLFKQYLQENLRYPQQAIVNQVEGKVTIQFSIGTTGQVSDFRVLRGIGFGCDEEVIRLIKDGPKWSPTKKNDVAIRDKVKVRMKFALPKK